jgi:hypothetical protein
MLTNGAVASRKRVGCGLDSRPLTGGGEKRAGEGGRSCWRIDSESQDECGSLCGDFQPLLRIGIERLESDWCLATENTNFVLTPEPRGFAPNAFRANYGNAGLEGA